MNKKYLLYLILSVFVVTSCQSIPEGKPPKGKLVNITLSNTNILSEKNAINEMTTVLTTCPIPSINNIKPKLQISKTAAPEKYKNKLS